MPPVSVMANQAPKENLALALGPPNRIFPTGEKASRVIRISVPSAAHWYSQPNVSRDQPKMACVTLVSQALFTTPRMAAPPMTRKQGMNTSQRMPFWVSVFAICALARFCSLPFYFAKTVPLRENPVVFQQVYNILGMAVSFTTNPSIFIWNALAFSFISTHNKGRNCKFSMRLQNFYAQRRSALWQRIRNCWKRLWTCWKSASTSIPLRAEPYT